jgi:hypothetical protein
MLTADILSNWILQTSAMLINEWQLGTELNQALHQQRRADFQLWLAALSPAIEEQAEFCLADATATPKMADLRRQLQLAEPRNAAMSATDIQLMQHHNQLFQQGGFAALRLATLLQPAPVVVEHSAGKLHADVKDNVSLHVLRHLQQAKQRSALSQGGAAGALQPDAETQAGVPAMLEPQPTLLYDMLQQLNAQTQAA